MSLFTILNTINSDENLPVLDSADVRYLGEFENNAYGHWLFDDGSASLESRVGSKVLTAQAADPTYDTNFLSITGLPNALNTDLLDSASTQITLCTVVRFPVITALTVFSGNLGVSPATGFSPFIGPGGKVYVTSRGTTLGNTQLFVDPVSANTWYFLGFSLDLNGASSTVIGKKSGEVQDTLTAAGAYLLANEPISLGNSRYTSAVGNNMNFAEFIVFDSALDSSSLEAVYERSKTRMASRGITIA